MPSLSAFPQPARLTPRLFFWLAILLLIFLCLLQVGLFPLEETRWGQGTFLLYWSKTLKPFLLAACQPSLSDQNTSLPTGATPFLMRIGNELLATLRYSLIAMSLALPTGFILALFASRSWWPQCPSFLTHKCLWFIHITTRLFLSWMRSLHEILWAIILLLLLGNTPLSACIALAIPFSATLGKVFSEMFEEAPLHAARYLEAEGVSPSRAFFFSTLREVFADMLTYSFYRFECALRASAVLGFVGIETIGLSLHRSFENAFYREFWTEFYLLITLIILVDALGAKLRQSFNSPALAQRIQTDDLAALPIKKSIALLYKKRPQSRFISLLITAMLLGYGFSWLASFWGLPPLTQGASSAFTQARITRFILDITPEVWQTDPSLSSLFMWVKELWHTQGKEALLNTLGMASLAILCAGGGTLLLLVWGSRQLARREPFGIPQGASTRLANFFWNALGRAMRFFFLLMRAIPEYLLAYLLIGLLGVHIWSLILALFFHNLGILGRLWSETLENASSQPAAWLRSAGGTRMQCYIFAYLPAVGNRFLLYLFYRWETCVREASVLGMLGVASLGLSISLARNFYYAYDAMFFFVTLGSCAVMAGDFLSLIARHYLRKTTNG